MPNPAFDEPIGTGSGGSTTTSTATPTTTAATTTAGTTTAATGSESTGPCPSLGCEGCTEVTIPGFDYCVCAEAITWDAAESDCASRNGHLASITEDAENALLRAEANAAGIMGEVWIGLHDQQTDGTFMWVDGTPLTYENWRMNQPDNANGTENCAELETNARWNDINCDTEHDGYICKSPVC